MITVRTYQVKNDNSAYDPYLVHEFPDGTSYTLDALAGRPVVYVQDAQGKKIGSVIEPAAIFTFGTRK